ncbi:armadillo-type protein [Mycena latifolia]|nr:armadillo-type protein [Mycena latifolia]
MHWQLKWRSAVILRNLAHHSKSTSAAVNESLVALLCDSDVNKVALGFNFLSQIANSSESAEGVVAANALHYLLDGFESPSSSVRWWACQLTQALASHEFTAAALIAINPCNQLIALSWNTPMHEAYFTTEALLAIAAWPDGAAAIVAPLLHHGVPWLASPDSWRRGAAYMLLEKLVRHKSTAEAVLDLKPCEGLVTALALNAKPAVRNALDALASIADWPKGAEAAVAAKVLNHLPKRLGSRRPGYRRSACNLLAALVQHKSTMQAVVRAVPHEHLVALLRDKDDIVRAKAKSTVHAINNYLASAQAPTHGAGEPNVA